MHTISGNRQEIHSVPTHLHTDKTSYEQSVKPGPASSPVKSQVYVKQIDTPRNSRPRLFRVPTPKVSPRRFRPQSPAHHTERQECHAYVHEAVYRREVTIGTLKPAGQSQNECTAEYGIGKNVHRYMRDEPKTLKRRHQRAVMYFGFQYIGDDKYQRYDGREQHEPSVMPPPISKQSRKYDKKRVPQTCLAHRFERRTLQGNPQSDDEHGIEAQSNAGKPGSQAAVRFASERYNSPGYPKGRRNYRKYRELVPCLGVFLLSDSGTPCANNNTLPNIIIQMPTHCIYFHGCLTISNMQYPTVSPSETCS